MLFFTVPALFFFFLSYQFFKTHRFNLPPSPSSFPVIGHLHLLKPPIHELFLQFSEKYGPIFSLRFGSRRLVVISSSSLVKESFTGQNDIVLTNRPELMAAKYISYNRTTIGTTPYGDHWHNLRRICSVEILSSNRITNFLNIRNDEIRRMLTRLNKNNNVTEFNLVELRPIISDLSFNNIVRMVTGKLYFGNDIKEKEEAFLFKKLVSDVTAVAGANNPGDYLPILKIFGHKFEKKVKSIGKDMDKILQSLLEECRRNKDGNTMVNHLLSMQQQQPEYYTDIIIKGLMMGMMSAGTETTAVALEWAMTNLLRHPKVLEKARQEIDEKIGLERLINEPDITDLPYLQNIVSETFRLFPVAPLLIPRMASEDIKIGGYDIPRETIVMVNAWAIHRDPNIWFEPEKFNPERFNNGKGKEFYVHKLMVFGNGRRICPGLGLGTRIVTLALGSLIQCFEWEKVNGKEIDMLGSGGMTMRKLDPLCALCKPRSIMGKIQV